MFSPSLYRSVSARLIHSVSFMSVTPFFHFVSKSRKFIQKLNVSSTRSSSPGLLESSSRNSNRLFPLVPASCSNLILAVPCPSFNLLIVSVSPSNFPRSAAVSCLDMMTLELPEASGMTRTTRSYRRPSCVRPTCLKVIPVAESPTSFGSIGSARLRTKAWGSFQCASFSASRESSFS